MKTDGRCFAVELREFAVELREDEGREPTLRATILTEGRAATGGRAELFAPDSVRWPSDGIGISVSHESEREEVKAQPVRERDGRLTIEARATDAIREAVKAGKRWMSVEFVSLRDRRTKGGVREVLAALVSRAALVANPEYDTTAAEVRKKKVRLWL